MRAQPITSRRKGVRVCKKCRQGLPPASFDFMPNGQRHTYCRACRAALGVDTPVPPPNPSGLCMCGCGQPTNPALMTSRATGDVAGQPRRYVMGHMNRKSPVEYVVDVESGCWLWQRAVTNKGYGNIIVNGRWVPAHRYVYEREVGPIPDGLVLDHVKERCPHRPLCVNPAHMEPVTDTENKRRGKYAKLTATDVAEIRRLAETVSNADIGRRFGIDPSHVGKIVKRKKWPD